MKKYLLGIIAVVVAIGATAFTKEIKKEKTTPAVTDLYWYTVTYNEDFPNGAVMSSSDIRFSGVPQTQTYANANDGCSGTAIHCLRGFSSTLASFPNASSPVNTTTKN